MIRAGRLLRLKGERKPRGHNTIFDALPIDRNDLLGRLRDMLRSVDHDALAATTLTEAIAMIQRSEI